MSPEIVAALLNLGAPGVALAALGWLYVRLMRKSEEVQERRVQDAQKMADVLVKMSQDQNETLNRIASGMEGHTAALEALKDAVRDIRSGGPR